MRELRLTQLPQLPPDEEVPPLYSTDEAFLKLKGAIYGLRELHKTGQVDGVQLFELELMYSVICSIRNVKP